MVAITSKRSLETHLERAEWEAARGLIQHELLTQPDNHWLLTQLGVTYYEQGRYRDALQPLLESLEIVPDCPLTLWNIAGTLDELNKPALAISIYSWLLGSKKSPEDDPCWESEEWSVSLKTDCVYRLGACFQHMGKRDSAEHCFREYINLLLAGMTGTYSMENAAKQIHAINGKTKQKSGKEVKDLIGSAVRDAGIQSIQGGRRKLPKLTLKELLGNG